MNFPATLIEATVYFSDKERCHDFMVAMRWPTGVRCPFCGNDQHYWIATRRIWKCKDKACWKEFSVKRGTIFEDSSLPLNKWLIAVWLQVNAKNGISSYEIHRAIGVTQKTAWFMSHRIRHALAVGSIEKFDGEVEADETYIGGKAENMHADVRAERIHGRGSNGKVAVAGILERDGDVRAKVVPDTTARTLQAGILENVEPGARLYTDENRAYAGLAGAYDHETVNHSERQYVAPGNVHTQGIENFWALFKRCIKGTHISVEDEHLQRYVDEESFRFNEREDKDGGRFVKASSQVSGKRLTYRGLTAKRAGRGPDKGFDWRLYGARGTA